MRKLFIIIVFVVFVIFLSSCTYGQIEDTNGADDYSLQSISDSRLVKSGVSYSAIGMKEIGGEKERSISISKFSGVYELSYINVKNHKLTINMESNISEGNFRIVLVGDGEIISDFRINDTDKLVIENLSGKYSLRIAGESAKFSLVYNINIDG